MKEYRVSLTPQAKEHLSQIKSYIAFELLSPVTAKNMIKLLGTKINELSYLPERNPRIKEEPWGNNGVRKLIVKNYYVYYVIFEKEKIVKILAVIYGRRDQVARLKTLDI